MNQLEMQLKELLHERAGSYSGTAPELHRTVRRARMRRAEISGIAVLAIIALVAVSAAGVRFFLRTDPPAVNVAAPGSWMTEGPYGFTSVPAEFPTIASGEFRGAQWALTTSTQSENGIDVVSLSLSITEGEVSVGSEVEVAATDDVLLNRHVEDTTEILDGAHVVFGATVPGIDAVVVEVADGNRTSIDAHHFTEYDSRSTITADYYLAFVPADASGSVHARDELGIDLEVEGYDGVSLAPHVIASGKVGDSTWSLEFGATEADRACLVFSAAETSSECFTRQQVDSAGPLLVRTFDRSDVLGVVAILSGDVGQVRLELNGTIHRWLPWFEPDQETMAEWPLRLVAVGLEPGTHGTLTAMDMAGDALLEEDF